MPDSSALLCESCGYDLVGFAPDALCPECAKPIARSLPGAHPGAIWQQPGYLRAQARTIAALFSDGPAAFVDCRPPDDRTPITLGLNTFISALIPAVALMGAALFFGVVQEDASIVGHAIGYAAATLIIVSVILVFVWMAAWIVFALVARLFFRCRAPLDTGGHALTAWSCAWPLATAGLILAIMLAQLIPPAGLLLFGLSVLFLIATLVAAAAGQRGLRYRNPPGAERHLRPRPLPAEGEGGRERSERPGEGGVTTQSDI